ncbi:MAG: hypothetical protein PHV06_04085, partial [bacterium]|nr:hypothetical protein [bacterium]
GKKLLGLEIGKKKVGTRNYFISELPRLKEGVKVLKKNIKAYDKLDKKFIEQNKDKTFAEIFLNYEILKSDINLLSGLQSHIALVSDKIYGQDIDVKTIKISELETRFPPEVKPFIADLELNHKSYNPFGEDWKNQNLDQLLTKAKEQFRKEEDAVKPLLSFKASIENNYMTYGFLPYTVFSDVKIGEFEKNLHDTLKNTENTITSYKIRIAVLNDTFKVVKRHRKSSTKIEVSTIDVAKAQQPLRDCMSDFDKYLTDKYGIVTDSNPDSVYATIVSAYRAFNSQDLGINDIFAELEKGNFTPYQEKIKVKIDAPETTPEQKTQYEAAYAEALKLPEYKDTLKKYIGGKDLNTLKNYTDVYSTIGSYKTSFNADLVTMEKMRSKLTYENLLTMMELDSKLIIGYYSGAEILLAGGFVADDMTGLTYKNKSNKFLVTVKTEDIAKNYSYSTVFGPYSGTPEWLKPKLFKLLIGSLLYIFIFLYFFSHAKSGKEIFVRPIAGLSAVEEAVGRATEMGRPVLYISGLSSISDIATLASINILGQVAKKIALYETPLIVPAYDPIVYTVQKEVVREAYVDVGKPDAFNEDSVFFLTTEQFAYAAGVNGIMVREKPATIFFMGMFFAESLIMAETGNMIGAIQIAGTDAVTQLPFFITACDYTLIGEELYAASAYLSRDPLLLGTLKAQDTGKLIIMILLAIGIILNTFGFWQEGFINFFENVPK